MLADDVDGQVADVVEVEVVDAEQELQVVEAPAGLRRGVAVADERAVGVVGDLPGHVQVITDAIGVAVARRRGEPGGDLVLVHGRGPDEAVTVSVSRPERRSVPGRASVNCLPRTISVPLTKTCSMPSASP